MIDAVRDYSSLGCKNPPACCKALLDDGRVNSHVCVGCPGKSEEKEEGNVSGLTEADIAEFRRDIM